MKRYFFLLFVMLVTFSLQAQVNIKEKVKDRVNSRIDQRTDEGIEKSLDKIEEGVVNVFKKEDSQSDDKDQEDEGDEDAATSSGDGETDGADSESEVPSSTQQEVKPKFASYSKFDFVAGDKIIFYDDFSDDAVAEFPAKWNTNSGGEVVTTNNFSGKWLKMAKDGGNYFPELNLKFPENITIEFDLVMLGESEFQATFYSEEEFDIDAYGVPGEAGTEVTISSAGHYFKSYTMDESEQNYEINSSTLKKVEPYEMAHVSIWIQKSRYRIYINQDKIFDIPKGVFNKHIFNRFRFATYDAHADVLVSNVRIASGAPDTRSQLITNGKLVTHGILFDVNSDKIKPESYGCVKEISDVLKENPAVKVIIIGHTDSDGDEAKNLDLSKRRATAVMNMLVQEFSIDASRMQTDGKGESQPVDNNSTAIGKAQNRRVEFVKL